MYQCETCHREFQTSRGYRNHLAQARHVMVRCTQCQKEFARKAYHAEMTERPFCGFACYAQWQSEHKTGEANPNYRAQSPRRGSGEWTRNRKLAKERDGHRCQLCGSTHRLHVHHLREWNGDDPTTHGLDNLQTVCASCHRKLHPMQRGADGRLVSSP